MRRSVLGWLLGGVLGALLLALVPSTSVSASQRGVPGDFTGYAFDTCDAPSQRAMDRWRTHSRYFGIGVYVAGMNRACSTQRHLTPAWVSEQRRKGWRLLPLVVGRQASCAPSGRYAGKRISPKPAGDYAKARRQGRVDARTGIAAAHRLGIGRGSTLWFDLEGFDLSRTHCRRSALAFVSGWTRALHAHRYRSGLYSSASSGIVAVERARVLAPGAYALPDRLWIAEWNGRASLRSAYIGEGGWWPNRRVHQFRGDHDERHGGVRLRVDSNILSLGRGTVAGRPAPHCGVRVSFASYPVLRRGDHGAKVRAAQCLLKQQHRYRGRVDGRYDRGVARAVRSFQRRHRPVPVNGVLTRRTWTALLSAGATPLLKHGSGGDAVRRVQRSLNATGVARLRVDGVFDRRDAKAVKRYQRRHHLAATGVVLESVWRRLHDGRR